MADATHHKPAKSPTIGSLDSSTPDALAAQYLSFTLDAEVFGVDIRSVRDIIQYGAMTAVPLMPDFVRGVINLRGEVVPVIDLHARFGRPPSAIGALTCIVIFDALLGGERVELGQLVDAVSEVIDIAPSQTEAPPNFGSAVRRDFILGMGKVGQRFVILLEPDKAFDVDEMAQLLRGRARGPAGLT